MNKVEKITSSILNSILGIIIFVVSLCAFYLPYELRIIPQVVKILPNIRFICACLLIIAFLFLYCSTLTVFRGNWFLLGAIAFIAVLIYSTYINKADNMNDALGTMGIATVFLVLSIAVFFKVNPKKYLLIAFFVLFAFSMANIYTVYKYWGIGMWEVYGQYRNIFFTLVGNYNGGIEYILPMAICGSAYAHRYGKWLEIVNYAAMIISMIMAIKIDSLNQELVFAAVLFMMILGDIAWIWKGFAKFLKYVFSTGIPLAVDFIVFFIIVVFQKTEILAQYGFDTSFHNRTHIWNYSMQWIAYRPVWGNGMETVGLEATKIPGYAHSHSTYLEIAYKTGFIGAAIIVALLIITLIVLFKNKHYSASYILSGMLFALGLSCIVETYPIPYVLLCMGLIYYAAKNTYKKEKTVEAAVKSDTDTASKESDEVILDSENLDVDLQNKLSEAADSLSGTENSETDKVIEISGSDIE